MRILSQKLADSVNLHFLCRAHNGTTDSAYCYHFFVSYWGVYQHTHCLLHRSGILYICVHVSAKHWWLHYLSNISDILLERYKHWLFAHWNVVDTCTLRLFFNLSSTAYQSIIDIYELNSKSVKFWENFSRYCVNFGFSGYLFLAATFS